MHTKAHAIVLVVGLAGVLGAFGAGVPDSEAAGLRTYSGRTAALELEGKPCALVDDAAGGDARGEVVTQRGADGSIHKHLAAVRYEDIVFDVDLDDVAGCPALHDWIRDTVRGLRGVRRSGALVEVDAAGHERLRLQFTSAVLEEVTFPGLDASSKERAAITLRAAPEQTKRSKGTGAVVPFSKAGKTKQWLQGSFRLSIDGVDTKGVAKIDALVVKVRYVAMAAGAARDATKSGGTLEVPNISLAVAEAYADSFYGWHEDFVIRGNSGQDRERNGILEWLAPNASSVLGVLRFYQVGIMQVAPSPIGAEKVARAQVELYVERMDFGLK
jgi:hypothetical protein